MVRLLRGEAASAEKDLSEAVRLVPDDPAAWFFRARARVLLGNREGALADLDQASARIPPGSAQRREIEALRRQLGE